MKAACFKYALLVAAVFALLICLALAKGGNCKNECEAAMDKLKDCKEEECTQICNATKLCVCPDGCQSCFDDVVEPNGDIVKKNKCSGCTDKDGYNFDKDILPKLQKEAKAIGCKTGSSSRSAHFSFALLAFSALIGTCVVL